MPKKKKLEDDSDEDDEDETEKEKGLSNKKKKVKIISHFYVMNGTYISLYLYRICELCVGLFLVWCEKDVDSELFYWPFAAATSYEDCRA